MGDAIQPSHPLSSPSPPAFNLPSIRVFSNSCVLTNQMKISVPFPLSCWLHACVLSVFSRIQLFATLWTVACQAPLSMGFSRQEYWSGLPCPPLGDPGCSKSSANKEVYSDTSLPQEMRNHQIKNLSYHLTLVRIAIIKKSINNKCWRRCEEKRTLLLYGEGMN